MGRVLAACGGAMTAALACAGPVVAQAPAAMLPGVMLPAPVQTPGNAASRPTRAAQALLQQAANATVDALPAGAAQGVGFGVDAFDRLVPVPATDVPAGSIAVTPALADLLTRDPWRVRPPGSLGPGLPGPLPVLGDPRTQQTVSTDTVRQVSPNLPRAPACASAQKAFSTQVEPYLRDGLSKDWPDVTRQFEANCLDPLPAVAVVGDIEPVARVAVLLNADRAGICTAYHWKANLFLTAAHCFTEPVGPVVFLQRTAAPAAVYRIKRRRDDLLPPAAGPQGDIAAFEVDGLPAAVLAVAAAATAPAPQPDTPALLPGLFILADGTTTTPPLQSLRQTKPAEYCRVYRQKRDAAGRGCIEHSCQALPGFSGAPLFVKVGAEWRLAGIHVSGAKDPDVASCELPATAGLIQLGNVAVALPDVVVKP